MKNKMNLGLIFALFFAVTAFQPSKAAGEIGIIDNAKILEKYQASVDAQQKITDAREGLQKTFTSLATELDKVKQDKALTEAQKADKAKVAQAKLEVDKKKVDAMILNLRNDLESKILKAISDEAASQSLSVVMSKNMTFYGGKDITDQVLKRLASSDKK
jgi:Skp family chaperone for outer membrane proteins